ncbi:hypothetical protein ZIOFF_032989 [Zingiber officinale]|uniref:Uncharacterized protein n=1 Tax=Zingiber officinale TaxID=94328 RepID=A0A8J5L622_ZINOF|nr:hypothetical protein ZIOFF_032989 [Zingiber officinale]
MMRKLGWFRKLNKESSRRHWPWKLSFSTSWLWRWKRPKLHFSLLDDLAFRILYCLEAVVLLGSQIPAHCPPPTRPQMALGRVAVLPSFLLLSASDAATRLAVVGPSLEMCSDYEIQCPNYLLFPYLLEFIVLDCDVCSEMMISPRGRSRSPIPVRMVPKTAEHAVEKEQSNALAVREQGRIRKMGTSLRDGSAMTAKDLV